MQAIEEENEIDDNLWLKATALNPVFDFLNDETEDIYSVNDGKPFSL